MDEHSTVWAFDLGKASIGECVRRGNAILHAASLLLPEKLAQRGPASISGTPANRYRAMKTRQAHKQREHWLETVWRRAGLVPLAARKVYKDPGTGKWTLKEKGDYRLEREFAPKLGEKTRDGAPSDVEGVDICYASCLLRIRLLRGDRDLEEWQIYKALRAALQRRGFGVVPWAAKEARKQGRKIAEVIQEEEKALLKADTRYAEAVIKWPEFKKSVEAEYAFPCYYDAWKMGLWNPKSPHELGSRMTHTADSTRNVRFDRSDVRAELSRLGDLAATLLPRLQQAFEEWRNQGWEAVHPVTKEESSYPVRAKTFGEFLCDGPAGQPDETSFEAFLAQRTAAGIRPGTFEEEMGALGQKTPRFDNRILNACALIPRFHVCKVDVRLDTETKLPIPDSLLSAEVTFLLKLKNLLVEDGLEGQRKLLIEELRGIFDCAQHKLRNLKLHTAEGEMVNNWTGKVMDCFAAKGSDWGNKKAVGKLGLRPVPGHEDVKAPRASGRSAYSRVALRLLRELILSGDSPSVFYRRLIERDAELLSRLGAAAKKPLMIADDSGSQDAVQAQRENRESQKRGILVSELRFLLQMRKEGESADSWKTLFVPSQLLDALEQRHTRDGNADRRAAIGELLGTVKDPIVRHRLAAFNDRLERLEFGDEESGLAGFGTPDTVVLEFVREDFMGDSAKREYQKFINERERDRKHARAEAEKLGLQARSSALRYELFKAQGGICLYTGRSLSETALDMYEIDHIVPRSLGGPDAAVNYVLTFREVNETKEKGKLTPYQLLSGKEGWDAYIERVKGRAASLRNKKVQLLLRQDAAELVERYTALAETAWISKLAQTIVGLRFGWRNGNDAGGCKRVIVISGGLTARIRRKYGLDKLLYGKETDPEVLAKRVKNRDDKRHHALDAMVLAFIPQWARDRSKEGFFRFPMEFSDQNGRENYDLIRKMFGDAVTKVIPRHLSYERPDLADTIYGIRRDGDQAVVVQRVKVETLAYKPAGPQKTIFDLDYLSRQIKAVRDAALRRILAEEHAKIPDESRWREFCRSLRQTRKDGSAGAKIMFVTQNLDKDPKEFKDLSKDGTGALRTTKQKHRGQYVYINQANVPTVVPVRVFESERGVGSALKSSPSVKEVVGYFVSYCLVELERAVSHGGVELAPGKYQLNTLKQDGRAQLTSAAGLKSPEISLKKLLPAGFRRVD